MAPTLSTSCDSLPPEGANFPRGGPSENFHATSGLFISFEGIDGAGKSTHIAALAEALRAAGRTVTLTREPGGTPLAEKLRAMVLGDAMDALTESLLIFAARRDHLTTIITPALARGDVVLCDRFTDATFAYQGGGRKLDRAKLEILEQWVHPHLQPDLTLLFDVPLDVARMRLDTSRQLDKFEREKADFFGATRQEYLRRAAQFPQRFRIIDSTEPIATVHVRLREIIATL
jgi:dTMP kinase